MRRWIVACAVVVCSVAPGWAFKRVHVGDAHRDFTLETLDSTRVHLAEALGEKATLVVFWAGWSPRSSEALTDFQKLYDVYRGQGLQVIAVDVAHQKWDPSALPGVQAFVSKLGLEYPVAVDRDLSVFNDYGVIAVPSTALLDADGKIIALLEGYATTTRDDFRDRVLETLGVKHKAPAVVAPTVTYRPKGKAARYFRMAKILIDREMPRKAVHILERSIREDPDWADPYRVLATLLERQGRVDEAANARARYAELTEGTPVEKGVATPVPSAVKPRSTVKGSPAADAAVARYLRMGGLFLTKGMPAQAEMSFRKALEKNPASVGAHRKLAEALESQGKTTQAAAERARAKVLAEGGGTTVDEVPPPVNGTGGGAPLAKVPDAGKTVDAPRAVTTGQEPSSVGIARDVSGGAGIETSVPGTVEKKEKP